MSAAGPQQARDPQRAEADLLLMERLRTAVWIVLAAMPLYVFADFYLQSPGLMALQLQKTIVLVVSVLVLSIVRNPAYRRHARAVTLVFITTFMVSSAASSNLTGRYISHAFLGLMAPLFGAALAPWGPWYQLAAVAITAATVIWNTYVVTGHFTVLYDYPTVIVAVTWGCSVYMAWLLEQNRRALAVENAERTRAEAAVRDSAVSATALAYVGEALIAAINGPALLERLGQLTMQSVGCDCSWIVLRKPASEDYWVAAHVGFPEQHHATLSVLSLPPAAIEPLLARLEGQDVVEIVPGAAELAARLADSFGVHSRMHVGLRRGDDIIGYLSAGYRQPNAVFAPMQRRILRGIASMASIALETTRLLEELDRANRFKSDFVANMSHELRTPLHVIIGYHELLLDKTFGPLLEEQVDTLRRADYRARELLDLINATLDLSRIETTGAAIAAQEVAVPELLDDLAREIAALGSKPNLEWSWRVAPGVGAIHTDPVRLRMVLKNLAQNALKFTPQGSVLVEAHPNGGGVEFRVADTGVGIAPEVRARIFEPFFQVDPGAQRSHGGAGLGLYIVRRLIDILGGKISVESEVGRGSLFRVWMPLQPVAVSDVGAPPLPGPLQRIGG